MYEVAMVDWSLTPEYITRRWTEELLLLMFQKRKKRMEIMAGETTAVQGSKTKKRIVPADQLLRDMGVKVKRVKARVN